MSFKPSEYEFNFTGKVVEGPTVTSGAVNAFNARRAICSMLPDSVTDEGVKTLEKLPKTVARIHEFATSKGFTMVEQPNRQMINGAMVGIAGYEIIDGKMVPIPAKNGESALMVPTYFKKFEDYILTIRVFYGPFGLQATVELLTITGDDIPEVFDDAFVAKLDGINSVAFKFNESGLVPAGSWPAFGVVNDPNIAQVMKSAHIAVTL